MDRVCFFPQFLTVELMPLQPSYHGYIMKVSNEICTCIVFRLAHENIARGVLSIYSEYQGT